MPKPLKRNQKWSFLFFILMGLPLFSFPVTAEELFRLEGVVEDPGNQAESLAIINGNLYQPGDAIESYRVDAIQTKQVRLIHSENGQETILYLKDAPPPITKAVSASPSPAQAPRTLLDEAKTYLKNPAKAVNRVWELKSIRDLAMINNAAVNYYNKNKFFPVSMRQLTLDGFLPQEYEGGLVNKYQFSFKNTPMKPDDLQLHADPIEKKGELRSFFLGADAVIRESLGKPAEKNSTPHDYPGKKA